MPRKINKITSIKNSTEEIILDSMDYQQALEEALYKLGWIMQSEWDEPYNSMFQDEHMMSLFSQQATKEQNTNK
jgi:hypothetical protein